MLEAPFRLARGAAPRHVRPRLGPARARLLRARPPRVAVQGRPTSSAKHGLEGLSKVIALEAAGKGVTSNTVCPGYVRTPLVEGQIADQARTHGIDEDEVLDDVLLASTPVKRLVEPAEVADMVGFLCGPGTDSVTGSSFLMDGGWTAA